MEFPFGSWPSPISAAMVATQGLRLGSVRLDGDDIYWLEGRPSESGRSVLVRRTPDGRCRDITPAPLNVRTRVHEYGGGACLVSEGVVYFVNFSDQRIYRVSASEPGSPMPLTPEGRWFYADAVSDLLRRRLICVREDHSAEGAEPVTTLVGIATDGVECTAGDVLASGYDFYSTPRLSLGATHMSWLCWRHPSMPWDETEVWVADLTVTGALANARHVAGGAGESISQPGWLPDGSLCFASDRDGWWRLYRWREGEAVTPILSSPPAGAEFGRPEWVFGTATWAAATGNLLVTSFTRGGRWYLGTIDLALRTLRELPVPLEPLEWLTSTATHAVLVAASPIVADALVRVDLGSGQVEMLRRSAPDGAAGGALGPGTCSVPDAIEFPTGDGGTAHAFYYAPRLEGCSGPAGERPPLIVIGHGGPTTATRDTLDLRIQFWTSRGFAVADVNYRGSSGYGREYRRLLRSRWGIADVEDMIGVARFLSADGRVNPRRLIIRGGSAGGYTTLAALTCHPEVFQAGASYYGISDLEVLARDTHKFESRYLDSLVGPYPERRDLYRARSPIHFVDRLACALILFQGLEDQVVPPNQSEMMADAVRRKGLPVAYLVFDGEQHGFRRADTIVRCLESELYFYGAVFGFGMADPIEPPLIDNLPERSAP